MGAFVFRVSAKRTARAGRRAVSLLQAATAPCRLQSPPPSPSHLCILPPHRMLRRYVLIVLLHAYIGARLLPALPAWSAAFLVTLAWLVVSAAVMPLAFAARRVRRQPLSDRIAWIGLVAMGSFSSLFVL